MLKRPRQHQPISEEEIRLLPFLNFLGIKLKAYLYILNTLADWEIAYITSELNSGRYFDKTKPPIELIK
ncbi:MAG: hypothetical protein ACW960_13935, partial [Candidatus Thorarchaeota archaeon]